MHATEQWADYLFGLSPLTQFAIFAVHGLVVFGLSFGLLKLFNARSKQVTQWMPVAPFFAAISMIFALFLAFHAAEIWSHKRDAERAFLQARSAIRSFSQLTGPEQLNMPEATAALRRYVVAVNDEEWTKHRNKKASDKAEDALHDLQALAVRIARDTPGSAAARAFFLVNEIAKTRSDRLWIGQNHTELTTWFAVLLIGLMTHFAVASVHLDRPRAGALALALLAASTTIAYWSISVVDDPYRYLDKLDPMTWLN